MHRPNVRPRRVWIALGAALPAAAGFAAQPVLEEVLVTAQKREQTLQDVPVAVSAFSGDFLSGANIADIRGLVDLTPGFNGKTEDSFVDALSIRGISTNDYGIGGDPSVPVFTDGVWQGRTGGVQMNFYDIERVEVVKGPQATLFGRNAIAGAISIVTKKPVDEREGRIEAGVGNYGHAEAHGMLNVPLAEKWFYRGNLYGNRDDGWLDNVAGGDDLGFREQLSMRHALRYAGEAVDAVLQLGYEDRRQDASVYWDPLLGLDEDEVASDLGDQGYDRSEIFSLTLNVDWTLPGDWSLHAITGFKTYDFDYREDYDARPERIQNYRQRHEADYYSQELRLNFDGERLAWFVGAAAYVELIDGFFQTEYGENALCNAIGRTDFPDFSGPVTGGCDDPVFEEYWGEDIDPADILGRKSEDSWNDLESRGYAIYGDVTWSATDRLDLTLGLRFTRDEKDMRTRVADSGGALGNNSAWEFHTRGWVQDDADWSELTPRAALTWRVHEDVALYANAATGYKAGGFGTFGITVPDADGDGEIDVGPDGAASPDSVPREFDPETSLSNEIGLKAQLLADTLHANLAWFRYTYEDLQLLFFEAGSSLVENLGEAENHGVEVDLRWLLGEQFELFAAGSWMDSRITDAAEMIERGVCSACDGRNMPFAPDWSAAVHLTWTHRFAGGDVFAKSEYAMQDTMHSDLDNIPAIAVHRREQWNFRLGYDDAARWGVALYLENAFNEEYFERGWANGDTRNRFGYGLTNTLVWPAKPRSYGASVYLEF